MLGEPSQHRADGPQQAAIIVVDFVKGHIQFVHGSERQLATPPGQVNVFSQAEVRELVTPGVPGWLLPTGRLSRRGGHLPTTLCDGVIYITVSVWHSLHHLSSPSSRWSAPAGSEGASSSLSRAWHRRALARVTGLELPPRAEPPDEVVPRLSSTCDFCHMCPRNQGRVAGRRRELVSKLSDARSGRRRARVPQPATHRAARAAFHGMASTGAADER